MLLFVAGQLGEDAFPVLTAAMPMLPDENVGGSFFRSEGLAHEDTLCAGKSRDDRDVVMDAYSDIFGVHRFMRQCA